jgi:regulator of sirC expression with transglutaminase-like and TPR domain
MGRLTDESIERRICVIRGHRVMIDRDLAKIYGVSTSRLNEQVKRNKSRFPEDFAFRLTQEEMENWISQFATSNSSVKMGLRKLPRAFTEHGAVAAAFILNSPVAVASSIQIVRAFNRLRRMALAHKDLTLALAELARHVAGHDEQFNAVFKVLRRLMNPPAKPRKQIGFSP